MEAQVRLAPEMARPHGTAAAGLLSAVSAGQAVLEAASEGFSGRVEGVFREGFYVSGPSETLFAVLGPRAWPGPLHLVVDELPELASRHDRVSVGGGALTAGRLMIRLDGCAPWAPSLPEHLGADSRAWQDLAACPAPELAVVWEAVTGDVRRGDLAAATRRLQGRGTGLTPSGDDVLAGILLVGAIDPDRRGALTELAGSARTTRLSRAFLRWAAAGQSIQPAHALLDAAASGDQPGMCRAAASLAGVGATSGRALVAGVALAATGLAPASTRRMDSRPNDVWRRSGDRPDAHL
ncbi:MAG: DUF2877 domain-containing protein [Acidimicrobiaceae bacterium]|nr:DUF2877 domain-containing protein [Acidimicrobiaceae bacterium]MYI35182.1 DUF2877 domain-containing protein [Acidimicrobiaceae bacterium]